LEGADFFVFFEDEDFFLLELFFPLFVVFVVLIDLLIKLRLEFLDLLLEFGDEFL
jgi:hypothetical protein